jgi:hypothetical protein
MVIAHDGLGRRTYEYDSIDPVRSRRDYTYTPNGQLDTIVGRTPSNQIYGFSFRYDDRGRPIKIATFLDGYDRDMYDLYWDDADRLIAASIMMPACRGTTTPGDLFCSVGYRTASWHYHYLGSQLVAATHQLGSQTHRYWAAADERGLIYRLLDQNGGTVWQSRWDANGSRTAVDFLGSGSINEMWVPFGLPGQVVLQTMPIAQQVGGGGPTSNPGTEAFASGSGWTWTRTALALNRWRTLDPFTGSFLQPDDADLAARLFPEGYLAFRSNPVLMADPAGRESYLMTDLTLGTTLTPYRFDKSCTETRQLEVIAAAGKAYRKLSACDTGACSDPTSKRNLIRRLTDAQFFCHPHRDYYTAPQGYFVRINVVEEDVNGTQVKVPKVTAVLGVSIWPRMRTQKPGGRMTYIPAGPTVYGEGECLADTLAHEAYHDVIRRIPQAVIGLADDVDMPIFDTPPDGWASIKDHIRDSREEGFVGAQIARCNLCSD